MLHQIRSYVKSSSPKTHQLNCSFVEFAKMCHFRNLLSDLVIFHVAHIQYSIHDVSSAGDFTPKTSSNCLRGKKNSCWALTMNQNLYNRDLSDISEVNSTIKQSTQSATKFNRFSHFILLSLGIPNSFTCSSIYFHVRISAKFTQAILKLHSSEKRRVHFVHHNNDSPHCCPSNIQKIGIRLLATNLVQLFAICLTYQCSGRVFLDIIRPKIGWNRRNRYISSQYLLILRYTLQTLRTSEHQRKEFASASPSSTIVCAYLQHYP